MAFASGTFSRAVCDRCGQEYKYQQLKQEWNGLHVCPECYEPKHPQLDPVKLGPDAGALHHPRPDNDQDLTKVSLGPLHGKFQAVISLQFNPNVIINTGEDSDGLSVTASQGTPSYTAQTNPTGIANTSAQGTITPTAITNPTGIAATSGQGGAQFNLTENALGQASTSAQGSLIFSATENIAGIGSTSAQGTVTPQLVVALSGLQMTAGRGTITFAQPGWGNNPYGLGAWNA